MRTFYGESSCLLDNARYPLAMQSGPEQLRDWMRRRGFNQAEASRYLVGGNQPLLSNILNGHYKPGLAKAIQIERLTGIPVEAWASDLDETSDVEPVAAGKRRVAKG